MSRLARLCKLEAKFPQFYSKENWALLQPYVSKREMKFLLALPREITRWSDSQLESAIDILKKLLP